MNKIIQQKHWRQTKLFFYKKLKHKFKKKMADRDVKIFAFPRLVIVRQFADRFQVDFLISWNFSQGHPDELNDIKWVYCLIKLERSFSSFPLFQHD